MVTRLVNCARKTLHELSNNLDFDGVLNDTFKVNEDLFDAIINLKPFQIPSESRSGKFQGDLKSFPVVDYRPLDRFWTELIESFGEDAQFYCNGYNGCKIGVKFDADVQKLKELIRACEELEVNNRNYTNSIHFENQINQSRYYK